jgi:hypothetical protein
LTAQFVAARAARDAIYLARLDVTTLPEMLIATAAVSLALVALSSLTLRRLSPTTFVPLAFVISAVLFVVEYLIAPRAPTLVARLVYLHVSGLGPLLASGFWLIATDRFDPRTARDHFGRIAGVGTLGGLLGALIAERLAVSLDVMAILLVLAALNAVCGWQVRRLAAPLDGGTSLRAIDAAPELAVTPARLGLAALAATPYLRHLAALVFLGTMAAALVDYAFKAQAVASFGRGDTLLRFFAAYYAVTTLVTFVLQVVVSRRVLAQFGLAAATASPSAALLAGSAGALLLPGLVSTALARGAESVFRGSLFRSGYEVFYTPIPSEEKRAAKSIIDVGCDRLGEAVGGVAIRVAQSAAGAAPLILFTLAIACSGLALLVTSRLRRGYTNMLERSLLNRAVEFDLSEVEDFTTRTAMFRALKTDPGSAALRQRTATAATVVNSRSAARSTSERVDVDLQQIAELRSRDRARVLAVLQAHEGIPAALVPHVIPLLAWDAVADEAVRALQRVAEERVGELVDALIDPNQPFAVRRRLPRVLSICVSQRAVDGLMLGLDDLRFEVRFRSARALRAIMHRNAHVRVGADRVYEAVHREVTVSRPVWESRKLLDQLEGDEREAPSFVENVVTRRAGQSLEHVFTLLSLVLAAEPLRIAFRGLHTGDQRLRGTALEYLECVLPPALHERLAPFLDAARLPGGPVRAREDVLADLLRSHESIMLNIDELRTRDRSSTLEK